MTYTPDLDPLPPHLPDAARFERATPTGLKIRCRVCGATGWWHDDAPWMTLHRGPHVLCSCGRAYTPGNGLASHRRHSGCQ